jgi:anaerobic dimethyl sulfoxide reductase subunit B (iron-sulfur subunit)
LKKKQIGFYFDQSRCIGCHTCSVACLDWNNLDIGIKWRTVTTKEIGKFPNIFVSHFSISCNHCSNPVCVTACPANAITKRREDGIVVVDANKCQGKNVCGMLCKYACPYSIPQFGKKENAKMQKCDLCLDRLLENKKPVCVEACPMRALDAGLVNYLESKYGQNKKAPGFSNFTKVNPSIVIKAKKK